MEAKELRIGNFVDWNGEVGVVSQLLEKDVFFKCGETDLYDALKPIPLSREWLLKFEFCIVDINGTIKATLGNFRYNVQTAVDYNGFFFCDGENVLTNLLYVHELQNLIFVLIKKELTIKNQQ